MNVFTIAVTTISVNMRRAVQKTERRVRNDAGMTAADASRRDSPPSHTRYHASVSAVCSLVERID